MRATLNYYETRVYFHEKIASILSAIKSKLKYQSTEARRLNYSVDK